MVAVRINLTCRNGFLPLAIGLVALAIAVFGWGLHSKLSLYQQHGQASAKESVAKLLSERERPASVIVSVSRLPESSPHTTMLAAFKSLLLILLGVSVARERLAARRSRFQAPAHPGLAYFFSRPPPVALSL